MRAGRLVILIAALALGCSTRSGGDEIPSGSGGAGGRGGAGGLGGGDALMPFPLPSELDLGGDTSAIAVGDVDADGRLDLAALVRQLDTERVRLVVAFGDAAGSYADRFEQELEGSVIRTARDSSSNVVAIGDLDGDGLRDVVTASGAALGLGARRFRWQSFGGEARHALQPALLLTLDSRVVVRGGSDGWIERCTAAGVCTPLPGQVPPCGPGEGCAVEELVGGDFDGDGKTDVLGGGPPWTSETERAWLWGSLMGWKTPMVIEGLSTVDLEAGDIDKDGVDDVVAQKREAISDFPSYSDVWIGTPAGSTPLVLVQTIYHNDNHNEPSALADASFDGCLDLVHVGVDSSEIAVRIGTRTGEGCAEFLGAHDPGRPADVGWIARPGPPGAVGIQQADVNGDGIPEWIIRATPSAGPIAGAPWAANLHFVSIPPL
jgi:hypothetical protein